MVVTVNDLRRSDFSNDAPSSEVAVAATAAWLADWRHIDEGRGFDWKTVVYGDNTIGIAPRPHKVSAERTILESVEGCACAIGSFSRSRAFTRSSEYRCCWIS